MKRNKDLDEVNSGCHGEEREHPGRGSSLNDKTRHLPELERGTSLRCQAGAAGWVKTSVAENGNTRKGMDLEDDEEFSSVHGIFDFGHTVFEENSQLPMP